MEPYLPLFESKLSLSKTDLIFINTVLNYVYSFGNQRHSAISELESNLNRLDFNQCKFIKKLPTDKVVYRWFDYTDKKLEMVLNNISQQGFYDTKRLKYSFSLYKSDKEAIDKNKKYGLITKYDLSKMSGFYSPVFLILKYLSTKNGITEIIKKSKEFYYDEILDFLTQDNILFYDTKYTKPKWKNEDIFEIDVDFKTFYINMFNLNELAMMYVKKQKEIILISEQTRIIKKENIIYHY